LRFGAYVTKPVSWLTWPGTLRPMPRIVARSTPASAMARSTALATAAIIAATPSSNGVGSLARVSGVGPSAKTPARVLVPPRSTPIQCFAAMVTSRRLGGFGFAAGDGFEPVPAVAGQELRRSGGAPGAGRVVREVVRRRALPALQDRHHQGPRVLDL